MKKRVDIKVIFERMCSEAPDVGLYNLVKDLEGRTIRPGSVDDTMLDIALRHKSQRIEKMKQLIKDGFKGQGNVEPEYFNSLDEEAREIIITCAAELCFACGSPDAAQMALNQHYEKSMKKSPTQDLGGDALAII